MLPRVGLNASRASCETSRTWRLRDLKAKTRLENLDVTKKAFSVLSVAWHSNKLHAMVPTQQGNRFSQGVTWPVSPEA